MMGRHRKPPSRVPHRFAVAAVVATAGGLSVSDSGPFVAVTPSQAVADPARLPVPALALPEPVVAPARSVPAPPPQEVTVGSGDTLSSIAARYGQTWRQLWSRNLAAVPNPDALRVGQRLSLVAPEAPLPRPAPAPAPAAPRPAPAATASAQPSAAAAPAAPAEASSDVVAIARDYLGIPYRWGGKDRSGLDCSGLVYVVLKRAGLTDSYRTSGALRDWVEPVSSAEARPGDLVFGPGHVGIYIGNGQMIDAPHTGAVVSVRSVYSAMYFYGRVPT